ncbi:MAG TPA: glycosyltransferase family 2 protein [Spirochaetia bacterium]|nr:glycosyltransferase family 2 protein [Spirochaetia bacterium]
MRQSKESRAMQGKHKRRATSVASGPLAPAVAVSPDKVQCSIVIPQYGRADLTLQCLNSLMTHVVPFHSCEVIVVDDASPDDAAQQVTREYGDRVTMVRNARNLGFAGACNRGAAVASGKYVVFLNNDTLSTNDWLTPMLRAAADPRVGIVGAKLLFPDHTVQHAGVWFASNGRFPLTPVHVHFGSAGITDPAVNTPGEVPAVTGACMLVDRRLFLGVGGFDEAYDMSCEDIDLCMKVREKGRVIRYEPEAVLIHFERQTRQDLATEKDVPALLTFNKKWLKSDWVKYTIPSPADGDEGGSPLDFVITGGRGLPALYQSMLEMLRFLRPMDRVILCDSGSQDGAAEFIENIARNNPGRAINVSGVPAGQPQELASWLLAGGVGVTLGRLVFWQPMVHEPGPTRVALAELRTAPEPAGRFSLV